ncbi:MAG: poly-beta-1,6-N-acetyl-D-glucosamine synthase [Desulfobacca sp.]|nr:poly-beta-1,6-N-acetyl-D-glucosamine synthase [Desulfobacca sp.]
MRILDFIGYFVFFYPLYMSLTWMLGGVIFSLRRERGTCPSLKYYPFFTIIIPAHNEAAVIQETVLSLENLNYPRYEVIVINDGSTDDTAGILNRLAAEQTDWLRVVHLEPNSGKSKALNIGILLSKGEFLLTIDADCLVDQDVLRWMAWHLVNFPRVGAVTGNPRVRNRTSLLGKIQVGEYSNIIGLIKRTQRILGKLLTVSGVLAAYRKSALLHSGLFDGDTVTEDIDITWKLQRHFWDIRYEPRALGWVLVPETLRGLWHQRVRWAQGGVEVLKKHRNIWLNYHCRRLWPVYTEYFTGILWAYCFTFLVILWMVFGIFDGFCNLYFFTTTCPTVVTVHNNITTYYNPVLPRWFGAILGLACLLEFLTSFLIDYRYEKKSFLSYYFWVIWYPAAYWIISALSAVKGVINVFWRRSRITIKWQSPDRGIHTLKSS